MVIRVHCDDVATGKHALFLNVHPAGQRDALLMLPEGHTTGVATGRAVGAGGGATGAGVGAVPPQSPFTELLQSPHATVVIQEVAELTRAYTPG